ncbi:hypothetical protein EVAR_73772_1 [Eumeta japonica]|uniref:Uncharacterized protein n=1 Tax=Eumeta variegata TaxID=151549 RepID=A0A4C1SMW2_EUMVA|nr:hypothetical protein EVAR_73772_1 [Eumeta japonica]
MARFELDLRRVPALRAEPSQESREQPIGRQQHLEIYTCDQRLQNLFTTSHHISAAQAPQPMVGEVSFLEVSLGRPNPVTEALLGLYTPKAERQGVTTNQDTTCPQGVVR